MGVNCHELVCCVKPVLEPNQDLLIDDNLLVGDARIPCHDANPGTELACAARLDFFLRAVDTWKNNVAQNGDPVHALGRQILHSTVVCEMSVHSQTLKQREAVFSCLLHVRSGVVLQDRRRRSHSAICIRRSSCSSNLVVTKEVQGELKIPRCLDIKQRSPRSGLTCYRISGS